MFKISGWLLGFLVNIALAISAAGAHAETENNRTLSPHFFIDNGDPEVDRFPLKQTPLISVRSMARSTSPAGSRTRI